MTEYEKEKYKHDIEAVERDLKRSHPEKVLLSEERHRMNQICQGKPLGTEFLSRYTNDQKQIFLNIFKDKPLIILSRANKVSGTKSGKTIWNADDFDGLVSVLYHEKTYETEVGAQIELKQRNDLMHFQQYEISLLVHQARWGGIRTENMAKGLFRDISTLADFMEQEWKTKLGIPEWKRENAKVSSGYVILIGECIEFIFNEVILRFEEYTVERAYEAFTAKLKDIEDRVNSEILEMPQRNSGILEDFRYYIEVMNLRRNNAGMDEIRQKVRKDLEGKYDLEELSKLDRPLSQADLCENYLKKLRGKRAKNRGGLIRDIIDKMKKSDSLVIDADNPVDWLIIYDSLYQQDGTPRKILVERKRRELYSTKRSKRDNGYDEVSVQTFAKQWVKKGEKTSEEQLDERLDERLTYIKVYYTEVRKMLFGSPKQREQLKAAEQLDSTVKQCLELIVLKNLNAKVIISDATSLLKQIIQTLKSVVLEEIR